MKTIGVLGGLGPQATMDFEARLHRVSQQRIPQRDNRGYPPLIVYYCRFAPMLVDEKGIPLEPQQPDPRLLQAARWLGGIANFLVIPANTPHLFRHQLQQAADCPVLSMIDLTLAEVERRGWRRVGVLELREPIVYSRPLAERGLEVEVIDVELRQRLDEAIFAVMEGRHGVTEAAAAGEAIAALRQRPVDGIILGCTELPLLVSEADADPDIINPGQLLAEAAVQMAME